MDIVASRSLYHFKSEVGTRFQLYSSLFTSLPFHRIEKTGILLSLFLNECEEGYQHQLSPEEIVEEFFNAHTNYQDEKGKLDLLFRFIQYVERQVVLFDALEDASFKATHDVNGAGTLKHLLSEVTQQDIAAKLKNVLNTFSIRLVLTAHPTQFYPGSVLGIIHDLSRSLVRNDAIEINKLLQQLGKTPFFKKKQPSPYDEAVSLIWYLENVFYQAAGRIIDTIKAQLPSVLPENKSILQMGFWPGGDRDGNPFVTSEITLQVAGALRSAILKCYYLDVRRLKRRLTFDGVEVLLQELEQKIYDNLFIPGANTGLSAGEIRNILEEIRTILIERHNGLFISMVDSLINKVDVFGLHFAALDIRQDSSIHQKLFKKLAESDAGILPANYNELDENHKIRALLHIQAGLTVLFPDDPIAEDTIQSAAIIPKIQETNGEAGCNRYIISQCNSILNMVEVFTLFKLAGTPPEEVKVDIVPLFETIDDLQNAPGIMRELYSLPFYREHLKRRGQLQTIMLGFSDGTKDGGYLMANWSIYRAKEELTRVSRHYNIDVAFFDGRGGPPSRGGGKTHKFYASMGNNISNKEIQLTIQGQTVSANFGVIDSAQFNMEQLLTAGITNQLFADKHPSFPGQDEQLLQEFSSYGYDHYKKLRDHPELANYLYEISPVMYYSDTNIASRPAKRESSAHTVSLKGLRAIPFAGAWSQLKQNVPGFFGVGTALRQMEYIGKFDALKKLYHGSQFLKTLLDNCEMAMSKSFFPLTAHLKNDPQFGPIWQMIYDEFQLTEEYLLKLSGKPYLMADYPVEKLSIEMRERIVLPLTTIQQYALAKIRAEEHSGVASEGLKEIYRKLVVRCSFGIINAGRNSA
jgi:phosphoenolpyruvate carboxylase